MVARINTAIGRRAGVGCAIVLVGLAFVAGGCGSSSTPSESELAPGAPLKIGYLASLRGFCAGFARQYVAGAELAVRQIDARGGVLGHRLELVVRDDEATPAVGVEQARKLVEGAHVKYLAGACTSTVGKSVAELVANPSHVVYVAGVSDPTMFEGGPTIYAFDTIPTTTIEGRNAASYVRAHPRWKRIAVISEAYNYGYQVTAAFKEAMRGSGQTIVGLRYVPAGGADYRPYIEQLIAARPDAVYSTVITADALTLVRQALPLGLFAKTHVLGVTDYATIDAMPNPPVAAEGYTVYPSAAIYHTPFAHDLQPLGATVANGGAAGDAFNQIEVIAQGIEKARSTDPTKVRDALAGSTVQTVQGRVAIRKCDHTLTTPIAMGPVVGPTAGQPFAHLEPLTLVGTGRYSEC